MDSQNTYYFMDSIKREMQLLSIKNILFIPFKRILGFFNIYNKLFKIRFKLKYKYWKKLNQFIYFFITNLYYRNN